MSPYDLLVAPFVGHASLRAALVGVAVLSCSFAPIGIFLMLRRMSLAGDVLGHAMLPGVAIGFLLAGFTILPMAFGGFVAGLIVALLSGAVARATNQREDASLAAFYLISVALGVVLASLAGSDEELLHLLFGATEAIGGASLALMASVSAITVVALAVIWRALVADCLDPIFLRTVSPAGRYVHFAFLVLIVLNLVAGFQVLGTLLTVGLMMLPAAAARFWTADLKVMAAVAVGIGLLSGAAGLLFSHHVGVASGPAVILAAGAIYCGSLMFGPRGLAAARLVARRPQRAA